MTVTEEVASRRSHCCQFGRDGREELLNASALNSSAELCTAYYMLLVAYLEHLTSVLHNVLKLSHMHIAQYMLNVHMC